MITAENISKHFGRTIAVDDISFEVNEGENLVLLGTSS
jgi:osmoprotectant transport system ATP-binding protein